MNIGDLPRLNNRRLITMQKQLNATRKSITMDNDRLKESLVKVERSVDRRRQSDSFRSWQKTIPVKNQLVEMNALKKCLRRRRESSTLEPELTPRNGVYDGVSLDAMKPEVKDVIARKAPTQRRLRKVEKMKSVGYEEGRLVDYHDTLDKLKHVLSRPRAKPARCPFSLTPRSTLLLREQPLGFDSRTEYSSSGASSADSPDRHTVSYDPDDETLASEAEDVVRLDSPLRSDRTDDTRPGLQLPPIHARATRGRRQSQYEQRSLPTTHSKRSSQLPSLVRRVSSFGPY